VRVLSEFLLRQLHDVGVAAGKLPALVGLLHEIDPNNLLGDEDRLGMVACQDEP